MGKGGPSSSEQLARSLEPRYSDREDELVQRLHAAAKHKSSSSSSRLQNPLTQYKRLLAESAKKDDRPPIEASHHSHTASAHNSSQHQEPHSRPVRANGSAHNSHAHHHRRKRFEVFSAFFLIALLVFIFFLAAKTDATPFIVFLSFLPTVFTIILALIIYEAAKDNKNILWVIPLLLAFVFNWVGRSASGVFSGIDVDVLTALNVFFSLLYLAINYFLLQSAIPKQKSRVQVVERVVEKEVIPEDLSKFIASIEDKGKALNFVIGRVYNAYHGGAKELRERINMKQEWYDQFSQVPSDPQKVDFLSLTKLISAIELRLQLLERTEAEVFGAEHTGFKNLVRAQDGSDKIIDVLDKNDKDPVKSYVEGALQFCGKVRDFIRKREVPSMAENEYVERDPPKNKSAPRSSWDAIGGLLRK